MALSAAKSAALCRWQTKSFGYARGCSKNLKGNMMAKMESKTLPKPDELRAFDPGNVELATPGGGTFGRATLQPGWKW